MDPNQTYYTVDDKGNKTYFTMDKNGNKTPVAAPPPATAP